MFQGKTSAALELLAQKGRGGILHAQDPIDASDPESLSVLDILKSKHPRAQPASRISVPQVSNDFPVIHPVVLDQIDASSIRSEALRTKGGLASMLMAGEGYALRLRLPQWTFVTPLPKLPGGCAPRSSILMVFPPC